MHLGCTFQRPSSNTELSYFIKTSQHTATIHGEIKLIAGDFVASRVCRSTRTAPVLLLNFVRMDRLILHLTH